MTAWLLLMLAATATPRAPHEIQLEVKADGQLWTASAVGGVVTDVSKLKSMTPEERRAQGSEVFVFRNGVRSTVTVDANGLIDLSSVREGDELYFLPPRSAQTSKTPWAQLSFPGRLDAVEKGRTVRVSASWPRALGCRLMKPDGTLVPTPPQGDVKVTFDFVYDGTKTAALSCVPSWNEVRAKLKVSPQLPQDLAAAIRERKTGSIIQRVDETRGAVNTLELDADARAATLVEALRLGGVEATLLYVSRNVDVPATLPWFPEEAVPVLFVAGVSEWFEVDRTIEPLCSAGLLNRVGVTLNGEKNVLRSGAGKTDCATFTSEATVSWSDTGVATWREHVSGTGPCGQSYFLMRTAANRRQELAAIAMRRDEGPDFTLTEIPALLPGTSRAVLPRPTLDEQCDFQTLDARLKRPRGDVLDLGSPRTLRSTITLELPPGFDVDAPDSLLGEGAGVRWVQTVSREPGRAVVVRSVTVTRSQIQVKDQADARRAWSSWVALAPIKVEDATIIAARNNAVGARERAVAAGPLSVSRLAAWAGLPEVAINAAREATKKEPRSALAWRQLIEVLRTDAMGHHDRLANRDEQLRAIDTLLKLAPDDVDARLRWLELYDAPKLVTLDAVKRVINDATFTSTPMLRLAASWWLYTNVHLPDVKWPAEVEAAVEKLQTEQNASSKDELRRKLRRYEDLDTNLERHEARPFDAKDARDVAGEVIAHRFGLVTRVPAAKVGVTPAFIHHDAWLSDANLDQMLGGTVEELPRGANERWVRFGASTEVAYVVLLQQSADGSWRASPLQEPAKAVPVIAAALDGTDEAQLRDALQLMTAVRAAPMPNVASTPTPMVLKVLLTSLASPLFTPVPALRPRIAKWTKFGDEVRAEVAMLQHAWGWPDDARVTAELPPANAQLRFDLAQLRGDFQLARTVVHTSEDVRAAVDSCMTALHLGDTGCFKPTRALVRTRQKNRDRSDELNNLAWAAAFTDEALWRDALVDARESVELDRNAANTGTRVVLEALAGAPAGFAASLDAFWATLPPSTMNLQFVPFAMAVQAEGLGFTDEARRLYGKVKPLVPQDAPNDLAPLAKRRLAKLPK